MLNQGITPSDPNAPPATPTPQPNEDLTGLGQLAFWLGSASVEQQQDVMEELGAITPTVTDRTDENSTHAPQGQHVVVDIDNMPDGHLVGSSGAGVCIGVIVHDGDHIYVFHFEGNDDVVDTMDSVLGGLGDDAHVAIVGGDGSSASEQMLEDVLEYLDDHPEITIDGYANYPGLWIDEYGDYHVNMGEWSQADDNAPPPPPPDPDSGSGGPFGSY